MVEEQKNHKEEEKLLPFWCSSPCSWISQENIHPAEKKYKEKCLNMVEEQKSQRSKKVVTFLDRAHESESKTSSNRKIQPEKVDLIAKHSSNTEIQQK